MSHKQSWTVVVGGLALGLAFGCADQGEGERCDTASGNEDCASGLVCRATGETVAGTSVTRCCPPEGDKISDHRCIQQPVTNATGGTAATSEATSNGGAAGSTAVASGAGGAQPGA